MEHSDRRVGDGGRGFLRQYGWLIVLAFTAAIYVPTLLSRPSLMDDVDAVQAQIARNMLESGDWVTARLNGVAYLEKSPLKYWLMAVSFQLFGVSDTAARLPVVLSILALCWLTAKIGSWAFSPEAGAFAGLVLSTCIGLFLFTRILIPDVILTLTITLALWSVLRALEPGEPSPRRWSLTAAAAIGTGLLLKGLIAAVFPVAAVVLYLAFTRQLTDRSVWRRLAVAPGVLLALAIAAPWHVLATLRNPPYLDFTMRSVPGEYHGFFWFYFFNEHVFRFLNMRHPRDYNTVPRHLFWLFHLLWLFPWSAYLPAALRPSAWSEGGTGMAATRAGRMRLMALCWTGFLMVFFTFSTTQEYYSMPCYPALALLLGSVMARPADGWQVWGTRAVLLLSGAAALAILGILISTWNLPAQGDISRALTQNPDLYTLSLGHMGDLTLASFAYLRTPLLLALAAFVTGCYAAARLAGERRVLGLALMMVLFLNAARVAMIAFDPYLASRPLAEALLKTPPGRLIVDNQYYAFSSVFFYAHERAKGAWLLNGRVNNLEYGSYAPGAPEVFLTDSQLPALWGSDERYYLLAEGPAMSRLIGLVGIENLHLVRDAGGKMLFANRRLQ